VKEFWTEDRPNVRAIAKRYKLHTGAQRWPGPLTQAASEYWYEELLSWRFSVVAMEQFNMSSYFSWEK
jgi:hypothetical protein